MIKPLTSKKKWKVMAKLYGATEFVNSWSMQAIDNRGWMVGYWVQYERSGRGYIKGVHYEKS